MGRLTICLIGGVLLAYAGWFAYRNPDERIAIATTALGLGLICIWLGLALPSKIAAHFGFGISWFIN